MMTNQKILAVVQAAEERKAIQYRGMDGKWYDLTGPFVWRFDCETYRAKPEPRERWINIYPDGYEASHKSKEAADQRAGTDRIECVHVREVLD